MAKLFIKDNFLFLLTKKIKSYGLCYFPVFRKGQTHDGIRTNITPKYGLCKKTKNIDKIFEPQKSLRNVDFSGFYFVLVAGSSQLSNLFFEDYYSILALAS